MKITIRSAAAYLLTAFLFGCNNASENTEGIYPVSDTTQPAAGAQDESATTKEVPGVAELLQGKWQHIDDKTNYLEFTGDRRKEISGGMDTWDDEPFILSEKCVNPSDKDNGETPEKDRFISCPESDLCWYIISVDKESLSLSYMGRGNTLTYNRVK